MRRHQLLAALHTRLRPRSYLETGINNGLSMRLSKVPSVGIDPEFQVTSELQGDLHLARTTSDEFFARARPLAHLSDQTVDLAFIDGMHLAEYALRDFVAVERFSLPTTVVVFDDMLPRRAEEAVRVRLGGPWTGDVYKVTDALRRLRPDLLVMEVDTTPTGTVVVLFPDATRDGVLPGYDDWVASAVVPDPQEVPEEILTRSRAIDPQRLLSSPAWDRVADLRASARPGVAAPVREAFADLVALNEELVGRSA